MLQALLEEVKKAVQPLQQQLTALEERVLGVEERMVAEANLTRRLHNRAASFFRDRLLPLYKERRPQPAAAAPAAGGFGTLPPQGMFPSTLEELYGEVRGGLKRAAKDTSVWCSLYTCVGVRHAPTLQ